MAVLKHTYMIFVESTGFSVVHEAQSLGFSVVHEAQSLGFSVVHEAQSLGFIVVFGGSLFCSVVF